MQTNVIEFEAIRRGAAYEPGRITDPSTLAGRPVPEREWLVDRLIPRREVTLFTGDGGLGKSLLMQQLATSVALGEPWLGLPTRAGRAFCLFCEDSDEELHRRQADIVASLFRRFEELWRLRWLSGGGTDCTLMSFESDRATGKLTNFFTSMLAWLRRFEPELVVIDTAADTFGGSEINRGQVNAYLKTCLGRMCRETDATVVVCGHPSQHGKATGEGFFGTTHWNNGVRGRLYLSRPEGANADPDERVLTTKKQNYGPSGGELRLRWRQGAFEVAGDGRRLSAEEARGAADRAYLAGLAALAGQGMNASPAPNQATYAPKLIARTPEAAGVKYADLEIAHGRLMRSGAIRVIEEGPPSTRRRRVVPTADGVHPAPMPAEPFP